MIIQRRKAGTYATAMGWQCEFNIGELCRMAYGDEAVLIGSQTTPHAQHN